MNAQPLRERIVGALSLQPMTKKQLSRCLCCTYSRVEQLLLSMERDHVVRITGKVKRVSHQRPEWVWSLA